MIHTIERAIVIGATGLVGQMLVRQLNQLGSCEKITAVVRHRNAALNQLNKVEQLQLDDFLLLNDQDVNGHSHAFSCLGSTIKKAGSKAAFYHIDFEMNAHFCNLLQGTQTQYLLVSAMGANAQSQFFYNRVKGELEQYVQQLDLYRASVFRPSLLLGERQEKRVLEGMTQKLYEKFSQLVPDTFKYKPVTAAQVAQGMLEAAQNQTEKFKIYDNLYIQHGK
ncbi:NAD-dependent epimerase/dehydratase family protein [Acinetobacter sp. WZC-1]|uniref:NAD-dependent epimerase/dehydratase family protein n=1 Tax=Acinetobacter sp. WZC-1 TaxID=3459034 RepID=UPI00403DB8D6